MDINYHYFAVKVLAVKAGFGNNDDAQLLASYSQFVDDFNWFDPFFTDYVPDFAQYLATKIGSIWFFYPVTTGFGFFDYPRLMISEYQRKILIPFHFMTTDPLTVVQSDRKRYRVVPVKAGGTSMMNSFLNDASDRYRQSATRENLIRIGTLLHTFADSYAHQRFSGFWNWENHAYLEDVVDNCTQNNITSSYYPDIYYYVPSIGHPNVSTAPDDSNVSFSMQQKYDADEKYPYKAHYSRSNPLEFLTASREILNYLRICRGQGPIDDQSWNALAPNLQKGFLTSDKDVNKLISHWKAIFPDISFSYDKNDLLKQSITANKPASKKAAGKNKAAQTIPASSQSLGRMSDDFFYYNVIADSIRKTVDPS